MVGDSIEGVWLQHPLLLLARLDLGVRPQHPLLLLARLALGVRPQPGLMRQALALRMGLQQPVGPVSQRAIIMLVVTHSCSDGCFG